MTSRAGAIISIPLDRITNRHKAACLDCGSSLGVGEGTEVVVMDEDGLEMRAWLCGRCLFRARREKEGPEPRGSMWPYRWKAQAEEV